MYSIPEEVLTENMCINLLKNECILICDIPEKFHTEKVLKLAVQLNRKNFNLIKNPSQEIIDFYNLLSI
jgi:predicted SAM-dependent methyltransferase